MLQQLLCLPFSGLLQRLLQSHQFRCQEESRMQYPLLQRWVFRPQRTGIRSVIIQKCRYGPFWLYTTMVFVVGAVHNVLIYQNNHEGFSYNFQVVTMALTVFYLLGLALSALIGLIFSCLGIEAKTIQIVCLYGYSMATYILCILLCMVNSTLATWILLIYAATSKVIYILKNIFESL